MPKSSSVAAPMCGERRCGCRRRRRARRLGRAARRRRAARTRRRRPRARRSDSAALHTLVRCVFALTTIDSASSRSACRVDVDVTVAVAVDDHRHGRVVADALDERGAAARNQAVDVVGELHHRGRGLVGGVLDEDDRVFGQACFASASRSTDAIATFERSARRRAAQQRRVARLEAQPGGVARDVGAVLVDDRHDTERHADPLRSRGRSGGVQPSSTSPIGIGQRGDRAQPGGHALEPGIGEPQPVERAGRHAPRPRPRRGRPRWRPGSRPPVRASRSAAVSSAAFFDGSRRRREQLPAGRFGPAPELARRSVTGAKRTP